MANNYKAVVFHHNDLDGKASGYCVHKFFVEPWDLEEDPNLYFKKNYNDPFAFDVVDQNTIVFVTDLSFTKDTFNQLETLCKLAHMVIWIDHHQSSKEFIDNNKERVLKLTNLVYFVNIDGCGALLTYCLSKLNREVIERAQGIYNGFDIKFDEKYIAAEINYAFSENDWDFIQFIIPKWLFFVDDYDRFKLQNELTDSFILGCDQNDTSLTKNVNKPDGTKTRIFNKFWGDLSTNLKSLNKYIENGAIIRSYLDSRYKRELINAFEFTLPDGVTILCKNAMGNSWNLCDEYYNYPAVCIFSYDGKNGLWKHSIFARNHGADFNAAKLCEVFGGGGHAGAAGFSTPLPIFTNKEYFSAIWKEKTGQDI